MLWPLIEFGSTAFIFLLVVFSLIEIRWIHRGEETSAALLFGLVILAAAAVVSGLPHMTWHYLGAYFAGAVVWLPIYWYLTLKGNQRELMRCGEYEREEFGIQRDGKWLPKHPEYDALVANGLIWFLAAPIHCAKDWINWIIDLLRDAMNKVQASLAVDLRPKE